MYRVEIQDKVRRLAKEPRENDEIEIQKSREALVLQLHGLDVCQQQLCLPAFPLSRNTLEPDDAAVFDELDDIDGANQNNMNTLTREDPQEARLEARLEDDTPEGRLLAIPSNDLSRHHPHRQVELQLRIRQASRCLQALRDAIADKSFQYSHVIRVAPRKGVRTRARATIAKLNHRIAYHARVYGRCRRALARLDADAATLDKYQILLKEDLKSSTALLNPNEPGSTRIQLSWIWRTADNTSSDTPESLRECECSGVLLRRN